VPYAEKRDDDRNHENIEEKTYKGGCKDGEEMVKKSEYCGGNWRDNNEI
jgi:hypothetical protein